jgi:hypothetical protein
LLFLMALLVWCLGLATVYPPGALIVVSEPHTFTENYNMSVMNPPVPKDLDLAGNDTFPTLIIDGSGLMTMETWEADDSVSRLRTFLYAYVNRSKLYSLLSTNYSVSRSIPWLMLHNLLSPATRCSTCLHIQERTQPSICVLGDHNLDALFPEAVVLFL